MDFSSSVLPVLSVAALQPCFSARIKIKNKNLRALGELSKIPHSRNPLGVMIYPGRIWSSGGKAFMVPTNMYGDCDRIGNLGSC